MAEFTDFMDYVQNANNDAGNTDGWAQHKVWRETTWAGKLTTFVLMIGNNPFTRAIVKGLSNQENGESANARILTIVASMSVVLVGILVLKALSRIFQVLVGKEIVMNQEIHIIEEVKLSDLLKELDDTENNKDGKRRSARDKKVKKK